MQVLLLLAHLAFTNQLKVHYLICLDWNRVNPGLNSAKTKERKPRQIAIRLWDWLAEMHICMAQGVNKITLNRRQRAFPWRG